MGLDLQVWKMRCIRLENWGSFLSRWRYSRSSWRTCLRTWTPAPGPVRYIIRGFRSQVKLTRIRPSKKKRVGPSRKFVSGSYARKQPESGPDLRIFTIDLFLQYKSPCNWYIIILLWSIIEILNLELRWCCRILPSDSIPDSQPYILIFLAGSESDF